MSFFDSLPKPPPPEPRRREQPVWAHPEAATPGSLPLELVLIRTDQVAVAIGSVRAYGNGFEFTVHVRLREAADDFGHDPFSRPGRGQSGPDDVLRLGVQYADGRSAATTSTHAQLRDQDDDQLRLMHRGGGGSARGFDQQFWLYPLPPEGPVTFVASWLLYGVAEVTAEIDGATIRAAAGRAIALWPEQSEDESRGHWNSQVISAPAPDTAREK